MASAALVERRERAAAMSQTLELPQFKGKPGWEFTDLSGLDLSAYAPAPEDGGTGPAERAPLFSPPHAAELRLSAHR